MPLSAKLNILTEVMKVEFIYTKYQVQNFIGPTGYQSIFFTYTGEVDFAIVSYVKCTK